MDTISRENNSYLPVAGVIVGVLAIVLSGVALAKISSVKKDLSAQIEPLAAKVDDADSKAGAASDTANKANASVSKLAGDTQAAFTSVAQEMGNIRGEITKVQEAAKAPGKAVPGKAGAAASKEPAVAGPDEYVIKSGDTFAKIARANGVSLADITTVNPGVNASKLHVGQKIKLPAKK